MFTKIDLEIFVGDISQSACRSAKWKWKFIFHSLKTGALWKKQWIIHLCNFNIIDSSLDWTCMFSKEVVQGLEHFFTYRNITHALSNYLFWLVPDSQVLWDSTVLPSLSKGGQSVRVYYVCIGRYMPAAVPWEILVVATYTSTPL